MVDDSSHPVGRYGLPSIGEAGATVREWGFAGTRAAITARIWADGEPRYVAVLVHGHGERLGRHDQVVAAARGEVLAGVTAFIDRALTR